MTAAQNNGRVLAVFADEEAARRAVEEAERAVGHTLDARIGDDHDEVAALRAEMREEMSHTFAGSSPPRAARWRI